MTFFQKISIKVENNLSDEVFLLLQTDKEIYVKRKALKNNKTKGAIQINKQIIRGIIY